MTNDSSRTFKPCLVYVRINGRISPQVWHTPQTRSGKEVPFLEKHELTSEQVSLSLDELTKLFPPPHIITEDGTKLVLS